MFVRIQSNKHKHDYEEIKCPVGSCPHGTQRDLKNKERELFSAAGGGGSSQALIGTIDWTGLSVSSCERKKASVDIKDSEKTAKM